MSTTPETIDLRRIVPQPWKNGHGLTRELAAAPAGARAGEFDWRLSVADISQDAPFSAYAGVDRCIVLLDGSGLALHAPGWTRQLDEPFRPFVFAGEEPVQARLVNGPTVDFNVMVRRAQWRAEVVAALPAPTDPADAGLLLCWRGELQLDDGTLAARRALLWRDGLPALRCRARTPTTRALLVRLLKDR